MTRTTFGLALAAVLLALPAWAQTRYQTERETQMQREEQMRRDTQMQRDTTRDAQMQRDMQSRARANPQVTAEELREKYTASAIRREDRATKLSARDYQELARQREELDDAIDRLERGGSLGAGDVDRIIGNDTVY